MIGLRCLHGFSLVAGSGDWLLSSCGVVVSLVPEHGLCTCGLSCSQLVGFSRSRDGACVSCIGRRILYHWAPREAQDLQFWSNASQSSVGPTVNPQGGLVTYHRALPSWVFYNSDEGVKALNTTSINCLKLGHTCRYNKMAESPTRIPQRKRFMHNSSDCRTVFPEMCGLLCLTNQHDWVLHKQDMT